MMDKMISFGKDFQLTSPQTLFISLEWTSKVGIEIVALLLFISGVFLNSLVITSFVYCRRPLDILEALAINLAVGDILASFIFPLPIAVQLIQGGQQMEEGVCKLLAWLGVVSVSLTAHSLLAFAYSVKCKAKAQFLPGYTHLIFWLGVFLIWLIPAFEGLPYLATIDWIHGDCSPSWPQGAQTAYVVTILILQTIIPVGLLTKMTVVTGIENYQSRFTSDQPCDAENSCATHENSDKFATQKNLQMVSILAIAFYIIIIPYTFFHLWLSLEIDGAPKGPHVARAFVVFHLLLCAKSLVFPLVYLSMWDGVKNNIKEMMYRCCQRGRPEFRSVQYSTRLSNGNDSIPIHDSGDGMVLDGEMQVIEELHGVRETNIDRQPSSEIRFSRYSSSDYDVVPDDDYRENVAIL